MEMRGGDCDAPVVECPVGWHWCVVYYIQHLQPSCAAVAYARIYLSLSSPGSANWLFMLMP